LAFLKADIEELSLDSNEVAKPDLELSKTLKFAQ